MIEASQTHTAAATRLEQQDHRCLHQLHQPEPLPPVGDPPMPPPYDPDPVELPPPDEPVIPTRATLPSTVALH
jgi:hypothetical protein